MFPKNFSKILEIAGISDNPPEYLTISCEWPRKLARSVHAVTSSDNPFVTLPDLVLYPLLAPLRLPRRPSRHKASADLARYLVYFVQKRAKSAFDISASYSVFGPLRLFGLWGDFSQASHTL